MAAWCLLAAQRVDLYSEAAVSRIGMITFSLVFATACGVGGLPSRSQSASQALTGTAELLEFQTPAERQDLFREVVRQSQLEAGSHGAVLFPLLDASGQYVAAPGLEARLDLLQAPDGGGPVLITFDTTDAFSDDRREAFQGLSEHEAAELVARSLLAQWKIAPKQAVTVVRGGGCALRSGVPRGAAPAESRLRVHGVRAHDAVERRLMADPRLVAQLPFTLSATDFPALGKKYQGKVRDTYASGERLVLITTDRLSAFDHVLTTIPFKGELLNHLAEFWFKRTAHVVKNHLVDVPDPNVMVAKKAVPFPLEFVVRGYLTGSLWRDYEAGRDPYALALPPGLKKDQRFPAPLLTPSTKEPLGRHDEPVSEAQVLERRLISPRDWARAKEAVLGLYSEGVQTAASRGLILVDTKYELGLCGDELTAIDEMHTPDSSRFWVAAEYEARFKAGQSQQMLDKENIRQWLITERGFSGHGQPPPIPDEVRVDLAQKYVDAFAAITGTPPALEPGDATARLTRNLRAAKLL